MVNKRAQNLTLGTILLMLLGVVVVVILIWGFSSGWSNLWDKITGYGGSSNVDTIKNACALACSSSQKYAFCEDVRTLKFGKEIEVTSEGDDPEVVKVKQKSGTCQEFATKPSEYNNPGIEACPGLCSGA